MWKMSTMTSGKKEIKKEDKIGYAQCLSIDCLVMKPNIFVFYVNIESPVYRTCTKVIERTIT